MKRFILRSYCTLIVSFVFFQLCPSPSFAQSSCKIVINSVMNRILDVGNNEVKHQILRDYFKEEVPLSNSRGLDNVYISFTGNGGLNLLNSPLLLGVYALSILQACHDFSYVTFEHQYSHKELQQACGVGVQVDCMLELISESRRPITYGIDKNKLFWINQCQLLANPNIERDPYTKYIDKCNWIKYDEFKNK